MKTFLNVSEYLSQKSVLYSVCRYNVGWMKSCHTYRVHIGGVMVSMFASSAVDHWKLTCSRHDIAGKLLSLRKKHQPLTHLLHFCVKTQLWLKKEFPDLQIVKFPQRHILHSMYRYNSCLRQSFLKFLFHVVPFHFHYSTSWWWDCDLQNSFLRHVWPVWWSSYSFSGCSKCLSHGTSC